MNLIIFVPISRLRKPWLGPVARSLTCRGAQRRRKRSGQLLKAGATRREKDRIAFLQMNCMDYLRCNGDGITIPNEAKPQDVEPKRTKTHNQDGYALTDACAHSTADPQCGHYLNAQERTPNAKRPLPAAAAQSRVYIYPVIAVS